MDVAANPNQPPTMTPIERIDKQLAGLHAAYRDAMRGRVVPSPQAAKITARINALRKEREAILTNQRHTLRSQLPDDETQRSEVFLHLLKLPIIADFLYDATLALRGTLKKYGVNELTLTEQVQQLRDISARMALTLDQFPGTSALLAKDDTLIDALHRKVDSFLVNRISHIDDPIPTTK